MIDLKHILVLVADGTSDKGGDSILKEDVELEVPDGWSYCRPNSSNRLLDILGHCHNFVWEDSKLYADFRLNDVYSCMLTPYIVGSRTGCPGVTKVKNIIKGVDLGTGPNSDPRIGSILSQGSISPMIMPFIHRSFTVPLSQANSCECGAAKVGVSRGKVGHSSWCPWSSK